ncbi:MAG: twin-arginine translocation signal domain-containing protein, partial [Candidatus Binatia bacterium]
MLNRREFLKFVSRASAAGALWPSGCRQAPKQTSALVNDIHSQLNQTRVDGVARPTSIEQAQALV